MELLDEVQVSLKVFWHLPSVSFCLVVKIILVQLQIRDI